MVFRTVESIVTLAELVGGTLVVLSGADDAQA